VKAWPGTEDKIAVVSGEELALRMMYAYRAAGNAAPDRAPGVPAATALRTPPSVIVD
jgi:hypothetical protein